MVVVISGRLLDSCRYLLQPSGWLLSFAGAFWMVAVISWRMVAQPVQWVNVCLEPARRMPGALPLY